MNFDKMQSSFRMFQRFIFMAMAAFVLVLLSAYLSFAASPHWVAVTVESGSISPVVSSQGRYAASNLVNSTVTALVGPGSGFYNVSSAANSMTIGEDIDVNNVYLVLTKGTIETIPVRIPEVLSGAFETYVNPSFAFPIIKTNHVTVGLDYSDRDISLTGDYKLYPGTYTLIIRNEGVQDGKTVISIKRKS